VVDYSVESEAHASA